MKLRGEVEVDEVYVPLGNKGEKQVKPRRRGSGRRRGRCSLNKKPLFTLVERKSRRALFVKANSASSEDVKKVLSKRVERGSTVYTDGFRSYNCVVELGYERLSVKHSDSVYALGPVHVNNAECRNWHLRAFLFFKRGISFKFASFYAIAASAFLRLYSEIPLAAYHWLMSVMLHA